MPPLELVISACYLKMVSIVIDAMSYQAAWQYPPKPNSDFQLAVKKARHDLTKIAASGRSRHEKQAPSEHFVGKPHKTDMNMFNFPTHDAS